jgi:hypothetical protein
VDFQDVSLAFCFDSDNFGCAFFALASACSLQVQMGYQFDTSLPQQFFQSSGNH